jgi:hypothetical protein
VGGVAANIGMAGLHATADRLERALGKEATPFAEVTALLNEFAAMLSAQVHAIEQALPSAVVEVGAGGEVRELRSFDRAEAGDAIFRLKTLLESSDANAGEAFPAVSTAMASVVEKRQLEALRNAIDHFEFETALVQLESISNLCTANGKPDESA